MKRANSLLEIFYKEISNADSDSRRLYERDSYFNALYNRIRQDGESPEFISGIIIELCKNRIDLQEQVTELSKHCVIPLKIAAPTNRGKE